MLVRYNKYISSNKISICFKLLKEKVSESKVLALIHPSLRRVGTLVWDLELREDLVCVFFT